MKYFILIIDKGYLHGNPTVQTTLSPNKPDPKTLTLAWLPCK